ncbi:MAG: NAD(P)/FAD-dependent oxidoreductase [Acidimicrobiaceae bacterium]|nr:NAD(P)/FAD-dependent oxidoreductase [Acidimicrobiaceae bacterium]
MSSSTMSPTPVTASAAAGEPATLEEAFLPDIDFDPDEVDVAIIGGGFGGLLMGAELRKAGYESIRVIEKAGDFGGTWYWNRYPGAMCDVESYCYLPLLEELAYMPKHKYSFAPEIFEHSRAIARHFGLYDNACLHTSVVEMRWDDDQAQWIISTDRGDRMRARFVAMANGPLNRPKLPGIAGIDSYEGHTFHTSRWDYDYTGGNSEGDLTKLADKRVGIIGTGATAVQCIPHLGESAKELFVFQRTPSSIDVRANRETDPEWAAAWSASPRGASWSAARNTRLTASSSRPVSKWARPTPGEPDTTSSDGAARRCRTSGPTGSRPSTA